MAKPESFVDEVGEKLGYSEDVDCDGIVRWDGERLYVIEILSRNRTRSGERKRDITADIVAALDLIKTDA